MNRKDKVKVAFIVAIMLLLGYTIGSETRKFQELDWCAEKAVWFLDIKGYELDINEPLISYALFRYQGRIDSILQQINQNGTPIYTNERD